MVLCRQQSCVPQQLILGILSGYEHPYSSLQCFNLYSYSRLLSMILMTAMSGTPMRSDGLRICTESDSSPSTVLSSKTVKLMHILSSPGWRVTSSSNMPSKSSPAMHIYIVSRQLKIAWWVSHNMTLSVYITQSLILYIKKEQRLTRRYIIIVYYPTWVVM